VLFLQQSSEKRSKPLWEGLIFIAWQMSSFNVSDATEGGIPLLHCPADGLHERQGQRGVEAISSVQRFAGEWGARGSSIGAVALRIEPSHETMFGGSR